MYLEISFNYDLNYTLRPWKKFIQSVFYQEIIADCMIIIIVVISN